MLSRLLGVAIFLALASSARAASLRVSAEPPLSAERLRDVLRSYVEGVQVTLAPPAAGTDGAEGPQLAPGEIGVNLLGNRADGKDAEVVLVDGEETVLARLPGALRTEDLYRAAALKVQALLQRRAATSVVGQSAWSSGVSDRVAASPPAGSDRLGLDAGLALMLPSAGPARQGLRLGSKLGFGRRWRLGLGVYLEPPQTVHPQGIKVTAWEVPFWLSVGFAWQHGRWQGALDAVGHATLRTVSAEADGIVSSSDTALSPRAGAALGYGIAFGAGFCFAARVSLLAALADTRYRVDGQEVWPAAQTLLLFELGLEYGVR
jgi:hypothetical protein